MARKSEPQLTGTVHHDHPVVVTLDDNESTSFQQVFSGSLTCEKRSMLQKFTGTPAGKYSLELIIKNKSGLVFKDENKVLQIEVGEKRGNNIVFEINDINTNYIVVFDPSQVIDGSTQNILKLINGKYQATYQLEYEIKATDQRRNINVGSLTGNLDVKLSLSKEKALAYNVELVKVIDEMTFTNDYDFDQPATEGDRWPLVANLNISHASGLRCAPSTNINFKIRASQNRATDANKGVFSELNYRQICVGRSSNNLIYAESHPVKAHDVVGRDSQASALVITDKLTAGYQMVGLYGYNDDDSELNSVTIPIHLDRNVLKNPQDAVVDINLSVDHHLKENTSVTTEKITIPLRKNTNLVELQASIAFKDQQGNPKILDLGTAPELKEIELDKIPLGNNQEASALLIFQNSAETVEDGFEKAGVIITDFQLGGIKNPKNRPGEIERIRTHSGLGIGLNKIFTIESQLLNGPVVLHCKDQCTADNKWVNLVQVLIKYSFKEILDIEPRREATGKYVYSAQVVVPFTFRYLIDTNGQETEQCELYLDSYLKDHRDNMQECRGSLLVVLEKSLTPEWLCVDFGTSAVVALYGANTSNNKLLPINKLRKEAVIPAAYPQNDATQRVDTSDESDDFLPSSVYLNFQNEDDYRKCKPTNEISKSALWLSPTTGMVAGRLEYQLPSMKLMLGFDYLPDIFSNRVHEKFHYFKNDEEGERLELTLKDNATNDLTEICEVNRIISLVYEQLVSYYLKPSIDKIAKQKKTQLQKIILTIPNTFTPENVKMLREMIARLIPTLHFDQIRFVSESDAVACYYLSNETAFQAAHENGTEYLLVFDMGAGTLDLTYLKREREDDRQTITIQGKMGVSRAGNYMDYKIATIIKKILDKKLTDSQIHVGQSTIAHQPTVAPALGQGLKPSGLGAGLKATTPENDAKTLDLGAGLNPIPHTTIEQPLNHTQKIASSDRLKDLIKRIDGLLVLSMSEGQTLDSSDNELKDYVRQQVKPLLSGDKTKKLPNIKIGSEFEMPITVGEILDNEEFKTYITETTNNVLQNFRYMFANEENQLPVDTLIFSGRSTHLLEIRKGVMDHLTNQAHNPKAEKCKFANMGTMSFIDRGTYQSISPASTSISSDGLKTSVAQGALAYVSFFGSVKGKNRMINRNIYANYGLLWNNANGWNYTELLNRNTEPTKRATEPTDGLYIDQYLIQKDFDFSLESVMQMMLIQTYSKDPKADWIQHNHEMISVLVSIENCTQYNSHFGPYKLELEVNESNIFTFRIGGQEITFSPHVDFADEALRMSIWPVIFSADK